jgi:uncharacterized glyoxalase superfamily protein PhnB
MAPGSRLRRTTRAPAVARREVRKARAARASTDARPARAGPGLAGGPRVPQTRAMRFYAAVLFLRDTEAAKAWYEAMGFRHLRGYEGMHWFALGEGEVMLHPADRSSGGGASGMSLHAGVDDVDAVFRRAAAAGFRPFDHQQPGVVLDSPVARPWGSREFEVLDPEGHRWAFTQDGK